MGFERSIQLHFRQTDMAGITYFNQVHDIFHDLYEDWVDEVLMSKRVWFSHPEWAVPLRKIESDFLAPLLPFEASYARLSIDLLGESSFSLKTEILQNNELCCRIKSVHVFIDKKTKGPISIPSDIHDKLKDLKAKQASD